jgi:UTP-glucose-1-phosphate uridylyltransferase/mevalonate kinase
MADREFEVFVPGRICLFGEHSDWAGGYRRINSAIVPGYAIICGTNQGIRARVKPHEDTLVFRSSISSHGTRQVFEVPMKAERLLAEARKGGFFSYVAGVAYQVLTHNTVKGLVIDNFETDLPLKKGLSSSAAVCVLTARAFNLAYDLKMTVRGEMDYAYRGEITTPSRCGRMDQGCAYGSRPVMMEFDGDALEVSELSCGTDFHFIIADLKSSKDTVRILADLNKAFPFAENDMERKVQEYLGPMNKELLGEAAGALEKGDAPLLGSLMDRAQALFDRHAAPACLDQLAAPVLHRVLGHEGLRPYVLGGKGVGSQGDGSVQFLARDEESREAAIRILEKDLGLSCLRLTIPHSKKVRKAVITAAGFGTRLFPMTSAVRKEFLPVVDRGGRMLPVILANVEEAAAAGIDEICIIIQEQDRALFESFFRQDLDPELIGKLSSHARESLVAIRDLGRKVVLRAQAAQRGLGHAVFQVRDWVGDEPFLLVLGDHLFIKQGATPCARQLVDRFQELDASLIGLQVSPETDVGRFGTVCGEWVEEEKKGNLLDISLFKEKPDREFAVEYLQVTGLPSDRYLTVFGLYLLTPGIFNELENAVAGCRDDQEVQLTDALESLRHRERMLGLVIEGEKVDIGLPEGYIHGILSFAGKA